MVIQLKYIFILMVSLTVFTSSRYIIPLGELSNEAYAIPFLILIGLSLFKVGYSKYKSSFTYLSILMCIWLVLSGIINFNTILISDFKGKSGLSKYVFQVAMFFTFFIFPFCVAHIYNKSSNNLIEDYSTGLYYAFYASSLYAVIEIPRLLGIDILDDLRSMIDYGIRAEGFQSYSTMRLRSLGYEAPSYATFLLSICSLLLARLAFSYDGKSLVLLIIASILIILTGSRGGGAGLFLMLISSVFLVYSKRNYTAKAVLKIYTFSYLFCFSLLLVFILSSDLTLIVDELSDDYRLISNIGRLGSQYASGQIFFDNPVFGVGIGQLGFYMPDYYPAWSLFSWEIEAWSNPYYGTWPPGFSLYMRLLAEIGLVGFLLFLYMNYSMIKYLLIVFLKNGNGKELALLAIMTILTSLIVFTFFDSLRYIPYWVGVSMYLILKKNKESCSYES